MTPGRPNLKNPETWFWAGLVLLTVVRMVIGALNELSQDESYYYLWTERLDWSYYSKGPGVALAIKLSTLLFGKTALGIRLFSALLGLGSCILLYRLGRELVGRPAALWTVVMLNFTPIFNAGSIVMTIDPLMIFFWIAAMSTTWQALNDTSRNPRVWWLLTGAAIGLGLICKYTILLQLISLIIFLAISPEGRRQFRRPGLYLMLGVILLFTLPVLIWNSKHGWITVVHLKDHTASQKAGSPVDLGNFLEYFGSHFAVYSPLIFVGLIWATVSALRRRVWPFTRLWTANPGRRFPKSPPDTFVAAYSLPIVILYFLLSFKAGGELNWTAPGFIGLGLLMVRDWQQLKWRPGLKKGITIAALGLSGLMTLWISNPDILRTTGLSWSYARDPYLRLRGWKSFAETLEREVAAFEKQTGQKPFLIANRYQTAAIVSFYFGDESHVFRATPKDPLIQLLEPLRRGAIRNQFSFWPSYHDRKHADGDRSINPYLGRSALYITDDAHRESAPPEITGAFQKGKTEPMAWIQVMRRGQVLRTWKIFACHDYQMLHPLARGSDK